MKFIKRYYPTLLVVATILYLSLGRPSAPQDLQLIPYIDKMAHIVMYMGLVATFSFDVYRSVVSEKSCRRYLMCGAFVAIVLGVLMEVLQVCVTTYRSGDIGDVWANVAGVLLGVLVGVYVSRPLARKIGRYF
ncbi:MAG: VanZ family protein [Coprobacter sp.]|nr:VanZ family protein [Coprobacter sp.]